MLAVSNDGATRATRVGNQAENVYDFLLMWFQPGRFSDMHRAAVAALQRGGHALLSGELVAQGIPGDSKNLSYLTEVVRQKLGPAICQTLLGEMSALNVLTLAPSIEQVLMESVRNADAGSTLVVEPTYAEQLLTRLAAQSERMMKANMLPVLLCSPDLRRHLRSVSERVIPDMRILSMAESPNSVPLKSYGTVAL